MKVSKNSFPPISSQVKKAIVKDALTYPSGDNCQPFRFHWCEDVLEIYHLDRLAKHYLNIDNIASMISLGCVLEIIKISTSNFNLKVDWDLELEGWDHCQKVASLRFSRCSVELDPLISALRERYTDRRMYTKDHNSRNMIKEVVRSQKVNAGLAIQVLKTESCYSLSESIARLDRLIWTNSQSHGDLHKWLRITEAELRSKDGMPWRTLGIGHPERLFLLLTRNWKFQKIINCIGGLYVSRNLLLRQIQSSEFLCLISASDVSAESLIDVGRQALRLWTKLNAHGCGVQPLSLASFTTFSLHKNNLPHDLSQKQKFLIKEVSLELKKAFNLNDSSVPVWLFRVGKVTPPQSFLKAPRIDIDDAFMDIPYDA